MRSLPVCVPVLICCVLCVVSLGHSQIINSLSPASAATGTSISITGSAFGSSQGGSTVKFNGVTATVNSWSSDNIWVTVPLTATNGNVVVTVAGTQSNGVGFTVLPVVNVPLVPSSGAVGSVVTLSGSGFGISQGTGGVTVGGVPAAVASWHNNSMSVTIPAGAATGDIVVTTGAGLASPGLTFTVVPPPSITGLSPLTGSAGSVVTITGTNFGSNISNRNVTFGDKAASIVSWSDTSITVSAPANASTGNVIVKAAGGVTSNRVVFTIQPVITSLSPNSAAAGSYIFIAGSSLGSDIGTVSFNGVNAGFAPSWTPTGLLVPVPAGATSGNVVVSSAGGTASNTLAFSVVPPPSVAVLAPSLGPSGSAVVISGSNFGSTPGSLTFNGTLAAVGSWTDTRITAIVPSGATTGNVVVSADGGVSSNGVGFTIATPATLFPLSGSVASLVTIRGSGFGTAQAAGIVAFNGISVPVNSWSGNVIIFPVPPGASLGTAQIVVTPSGGLPTNTMSFIVTPGIASISPASGTSGTAVTIQGSNFGQSQDTSTLTLNGLIAQISSWSDTQIQATVPAGASTGVVQATIAGLTSNPVAFNIVCNTPLTSIAITPNNITAFPFQSVPISVVNGCGQQLSGVTLVSADPTIAAVSADTPPRLVGNSPGTTTITASFSGLTAQATVTTLATQGFADGASVFSLTPSSDVDFTFVVPATRTSNHATALFFADARPDALTVRATDLDGSQLWSADLPRSGNSDLVPDNNGGLITSINTADALNTIIESIDAEGNLAWSYGVAHPSPSSEPLLSVASDGTVYFVDDSMNIVALDGNSGTPKFAASAGQFSSGFGSAGRVSIMPDGSACTAVFENPLGHVSFTDFPTQPTVLELTCARPDGTAGTSVLQTVTSTSVKDQFGVTNTDIFGLSPSSVIPDENGNVLVLYQMSHQHFTEGLLQALTNQTFVSVSGNQVALPSVCDNTDIGSTSMILGDVGNIIVLCKEPPQQPTVVSVNIATGNPNWTWSPPQNHRITLNTAIPGGGISVTDATLNPSGLGVAQWNVADINGAGSAVYESWSVAPSSSGGDDFLSINDGMYIHSSTVANSLIVATPNEADSAWSGLFAQHNQNRSQGVEFRAVRACSGFDETVNPRMLMVPASASNSAVAQLHGQNRQDIRFSSDNPSVTVTPTTATGNSTTLTITAAQALDPQQTIPVTISATSVATPGLVYGTMRAVVKPRLTSNNFHMYRITESVRNLIPQTVPTPLDLQNYLNNTTWGAQANVFFNISNTDPIALPVHYDLLPAPNGDGMLNDFVTAGSSVEFTAIALAISTQDPLAPTFDHTVVAYVNQFGPPGPGICNPGEECTIDGETSGGGHFSIVQDAQTADANSRVNVTAHEIGHGMNARLLNARTPLSENISLMWKGRGTNDPANPCEIRDREWQLVNPTPNDGRQLVPTQ